MLKLLCKALAIMLLCGVMLMFSVGAAPAEQPTSATVAAVGDLMFMIAQNNAARSGGGHNYDSMFAPIASILQSADIAVGNLEAPVAPSVSVAVDGARFNAPEGAIPSLQRAGFDYVATANNHAADAGRAGLLQTLRLLDSYGMRHSGTQSSSGASKYAMMDANGISFAILSYTFSFSRSGVISSSERSWMINFINEANIKRDIQNAHNAGADIIMVNMHWDTEYTSSTSSSTKTMADRILGYGADIILGHHPHTLQPMVRKTVTDSLGRTKQRFVAYSLGNFLSNIDRANSKRTCILQLHFRKDESGAHFTHASYVPVVFSRSGGAHRMLHASGADKSGIESVLGRSAATPTTSAMGHDAGGDWKPSGDTWTYNYTGGKMHTGWLVDGRYWYYFDPDGLMQTGWVYDRGSYYYLDESGAMQKGWRKLGGEWYYLSGTGAMRIGWAKIDGKWYYFDGTGAMQTGWTEVGGRWYYLDASGVMQTGWRRLGASWYYLSGTGFMQTGWVKTGGKWYYFDGSGVMQTGWTEVSGKWYYLDGSGVMQTGWVKAGGTWYYLYGDGSMAKNTTIDGYRMGPSGAWVQ